MKQLQTYIIAPAHAGLTVEEYIKKVAGYSGRALQKLTRSKGILLNNKPVFLQRKLKTDDQLRIRLARDADYGVTPEAGAIEILYEDEQVIVLNKPPRQLVHPTGQTTHGTLANFLAHALQARGELCTIRPVHRLDRDTSGCIVIAKTAHAQAALTEQQQNGQFKRTYQALVSGQPTPPTGSICLPLGKDPHHPNRRMVTATGQPAVTHYQTLQTFPQATLLTLQLETGRTHQIRVHTAHLGHPIIGDKMYGKASLLISRQFLHAAAVTFTHLVSGDPVEVTAPLTPDLALALTQLSH